jgi:hypothetical protein
MSAEKLVKFLPAFFVDVIDPSVEYPAEMLPHRITLFPPLKQAYDPAYGVDLRKLVNPLTPFDVTVSGDDMFGDNLEIPVKRIEDSDELQELHAQLVVALGNLTHDATYRQPYAPHISVKEHSDIPDGQKIHIEGFTIVEKVSGAAWIVRDQMRLKGNG